MKQRVKAVQQVDFSQFYPAFNLLKMIAIAAEIFNLAANNTT